MRISVIGATTLVIAAIFTLLTVPDSKASEIEPVISYQGFLTDNSGAPLDGTFDMNFMINDSTGSLWQELHIGVPVNNGNFMVVLGETDPIPPDALVNGMDSEQFAVRNLQIQIGADPPMSPTSRLLTVPFSVGSRRLAGDIFTSPGSIRMGVEPEPFLPLMEMNVFQDSASIRMGIEPDPFEPAVEINTNPNTSSFRMGVEPVPFQPAAEIIAGQNTTEFSMGVEPDPFDPAPEMEMLMDENSTTFRMGIDPTPFQPTVEINSSLNTTTFRMGIEPEPFSPDPEVVISMDSNSTSFRMGVDPEPFYPTAEINSSHNTTTFSMGIEPQPFDPAPEMEMLMDESSTTFRMGVDPVPFSPSVEFQALTDMTNFTMFDPTAGPNGGAISEMTASVGGQFSWLMFNPQPEPPGRPIMDMSTGPGGEISWVMFNPQPEPPGHAWMDFGTNSTGPIFEMTAPGQLGGTTSDITNPMLSMNADSAGPEMMLKRRFLSPAGGQDSTLVSLSVDSTRALIDMFGPFSGNSPTIRMMTDNGGPFVGIGATPSNILTVRQGSSTDPIADAWTTYSSRRWKKNIRTIDNALGKIERLRGVTFDWKADGKRDIGLIAEEVGEVIPEVVAYEENGVDAKSVDYARLVSVLIEAVKEQQAEINDLRDKLQQVSSRVEYIDESNDVRYVNHEDQGVER